MEAPGLYTSLCWTRGNYFALLAAVWWTRCDVCPGFPNSKTHPAAGETREQPHHRRCTCHTALLSNDGSQPKTQLFGGEVAVQNESSCGFMPTCVCVWGGKIQTWSVKVNWLPYCKSKNQTNCAFFVCFTRGEGYFLFYFERTSTHFLYSTIIYYSHRFDLPTCVFSVFCCPVLSW